ncbi:MAG: N-acetylmuramic acid 6-phosphate etherase [Planctomycetes bacterium]|nr:N-acetylmuramic acid 6-phosphate etherase [Planctomycetota bacterium]
MHTPSAPRDQLSTEQRNPRSLAFDTLSVADAVALMQREDQSIHAALAEARSAITHAIELIVERLRRGGRLIYVGAGTSGRLGVLDATECPPTFQTPRTLVQAVLAGGAVALQEAVEGAEDDASAAARELVARALGANDIVFGISAGGTTPFVHGAIECARERGAASVFLACVPWKQAPDRADVSIRVVTGPEVLTGSTRLKAGTATKLVLNTVTTVALAQLGKVYDNLMVDVDTSKNAKLVDRGARIVSALTGVDRDDALELLRAASGQVKVAVVMRSCGCSAERALALLSSAGGSLRATLERHTPR